MTEAEWTQPLTLPELRRCLMSGELFNGWRVISMTAVDFGYRTELLRDMDEATAECDPVGDNMVVNFRPFYIEMTSADGLFREYKRPSELYGKTPHTIVSDDVFGWDDNIPLGDVSLVYQSPPTGGPPRPVGVAVPRGFTVEGAARIIVMGDYMHGATHDDKGIAALPSDDELYGKAVRDESGQPISKTTPPARIDRPNQDLAWFQTVKANMDRLKLTGDEPLPEPTEAPAAARARGGPVKAWGANPEPPQSYRTGQYWGYTRSVRIWNADGYEIKQIVAWDCGEGWVEDDTGAKHYGGIHIEWEYA